jgi:hypothetical protein
MAYAILFPNPEKGGRGKKTLYPVKGFSAARLSQARAVLDYSEPLALEVRDGGRTLNEAYDKVSQSNFVRGKFDRPLSITRPLDGGRLLPFIVADRANPRRVRGRRRLVDELGGNPSLLATDLVAASGSAVDLTAAS